MTDNLVKALFFLIVFTVFLFQSLFSGAQPSTIASYHRADILFVAQYQRGIPISIQNGQKQLKDPYVCQK